ncbi:C1 family peptidase, partial [Escherichia coli]|nr:C1 family peptidase [Escherichia coli]
EIDPTDGNYYPVSLTMRILLAVLALGLASALDINAEWTLFKKTYNKVYNDAEDEGYRRRVYEYHLEFIQQFNLEADRGLHTFRVGINEYADMPNHEFRRIMNGLLKRNETKFEGSTFLLPNNIGDLPTEVDWRTKGYVTPVKNQGQCGSCWAFSSTGSLEGQWFKKTGKLVSLSEQNLVDCSQKEGNHGCSGGLMDQAFTYIRKNKGIDTEVSYPYLAKDEKCHFKSAAVGAQDTGYVDVTQNSESALQTAVATVGPVSVAIDASHTSFQLYKTGIYYEPQCSSENLDHGVLAVGYGTSESKDYWIVKNSWGTTWGEQGYIMMSRNRNNNCGIATMASYPTV